MPTQTYDVPGISCEHCQAAIEKEVAQVPGVTDVTVDIDARQATVAGGIRGGFVVGRIFDCEGVAACARFRGRVGRIRRGLGGGWSRAGSAVTAGTREGQNGRG